MPKKGKATSEEHTEQPETPKKKISKSKDTTSATSAASSLMATAVSAPAKTSGNRGLGKKIGKAKRHQKVPSRKPEEEVTWASTVRMARKAGVKRLRKAEVLHLTRQIVYALAGSLIDSARIRTDSEKRNTISARDMVWGAQQMGILVL